MHGEYEVDIMGDNVGTQSHGVVGCHMSLYPDLELLSDDEEDICIGAKCNVLWSDWLCWW